RRASAGKWREAALMDKPVLLVTRLLPAAVLEEAAREFELRLWERDEPIGANFEAMARGCDAVLVMATDRLDRGRLESLASHARARRLGHAACWRPGAWRCCRPGPSSSTSLAEMWSTSPRFWMRSQKGASMRQVSMSTATSRSLIHASSGCPGPPCCRTSG